MIPTFSTHHLITLRTPDELNKGKERKKTVNKAYLCDGERLVAGKEEE